MEDHSIRDQQPTEGQPPRRRLPTGVIAALAVVLFSGSATALWTWQRVTSSNNTEGSAPITQVTPTTPATTQPSDPVPDPVAVEQNVQVYWLKDTGTRLEVVPQDLKVQTDDQPEAVLSAAFEQLFQGPESGELASTIPAETKLLGLEVKEDGVHVDLSQAFTTGGGSASMTGRLAQVIYTASALQPDAPVWLSVEGQPLEVLGGEGLLVDQPMTRSTFEQNFEL